jgi:hypothetical protein
MQFLTVLRITWSPILEMDPPGEGRGVLGPKLTGMCGPKRVSKNSPYSDMKRLRK